MNDTQKEMLEHNKAMQERKVLLDKAMADGEVAKKAIRDEAEGKIKAIDESVRKVSLGEQNG